MLARRGPGRQPPVDDVVSDALDLDLGAAEAERRDHHVVERLAVKADQRRVRLLHEAHEPSRGVRLVTPQVEPLTRLYVLSAEKGAVGQRFRIKHPGAHWS